MTFYEGSMLSEPYSNYISSELEVINTVTYKKKSVFSVSKGN